MELAIGSIVRRVLFIIREEFKAERDKADREAVEGGASSGRSSPSNASMQPSLSGVLASSHGSDYTAPVKNLLSNVMSQVNEELELLASVQESISDQAEDHIPDGAKILTFGKSRSVETFFRAAHKKNRSFQVMVVESAPYYGGTEMAKCLCAAGMDTTLITDAAVFAVMPLVDKVFLPTHAVMANGGLIAPSGSHNVALAAREHGVPVVCITGLFKLCPLYPHDLDAFNELAGPEEVLDYEEDQALCDRAEVLNPEYDFVPPDLLDLYVTNTGGHQPSYVYRLLAEGYHPDDRTLNAAALDNR